MFFTKEKWAVNSFKQEKGTTEMFREKKLKSSQAVVRNCSTDCLFREFQTNSPKNVSAPETCGVTKYRPNHGVCLL